MYFDKNTVKAAAHGRWDRIFWALAPKLAKAQECAGRHVPCPVHGGTDGFRLFKNYAETGSGICNSCGARTDGFAMLMWVNGWSFAEAVKSVGEFLQVHPEAFHSARANPDPTAAGSPRASPTATARRTPPEPQSFGITGRVLWFGNEPLKENGPMVFTLAVCGSDGEPKRLRGVQLSKVLHEAGVRRGDLIRIDKIGVTQVQTPSGLRQRNEWSCRVLETASPSTPPVEAAQSAKRPEPAAVQTLLPEAVKAEKLWRIAAEIRSDSPAGRYLASRGILNSNFESDALREVRHAYFTGEHGKTSRWPAMVAAVQTADGRLATLHRTFLTPEGRKAPVDEPKKLMQLPAGGTIKGASIHLGKPKDSLCVAEGIETALSVQKATGIPTWCALCANGLKTIDIPADVRVVLIFADKDRSGVGQEAAEALRARLSKEGKLAVVMSIPDAIPDGAKGIDWNDVLMKQGVSAFPVQA